MSQNSDQTLEFFCPKCNQRLRAANRLAGQRLVCPKCQQSVKVPGIQNSQNDDAQWLDLDAPPTPASSSPANSSSTHESNPSSADDPFHFEIPDLAPPSTSAPVPKPTTQPATTQRTAISKPPGPPPKSTVSPKASEATSSKAKPIPEEPAPSISPLEPPSPDDDDLPLLAPESPNSSSNVFASDLFASIRLEDTPPQPAARRPSSKSDPERALDAETEAHNAEYRIICRTCGTPQYVPLRKQGKSIRCPDCHSEFVIPPPPPNWDPKAKSSKASAKQVDHEVSLAADAGPVPEMPEPTRLSAQEYLNKAEQSNIDDAIDSVYSANEFDSQEFMRRNFAIFSDVFVWGHALVLGLSLGAVMGILVALNGFDKIPAIAVDLIGLVICGALLGVHFLCGYALVDAGAHRRHKVRYWPLGNFSSIFGDGKPVLAASLLSVAPGALLGSLAILAGLTTVFSMIPMFLSFWALFPITLLSMLNSESISTPFSAKVFASFGPGKEEWGAHYFKTGLVSFIAYLTICVGLTNPILAVMAGVALPLAFFYVCFQTGTLGASIARWLDVDIGQTDDDPSTSEALPR